jgi:hypothetical protein
MRFRRPRSSHTLRRTKPVGLEAFIEPSSSRFRVKTPKNKSEVMTPPIARSAERSRITEGSSNVHPSQYLPPTSYSHRSPSDARTSTRYVTIYGTEADRGMQYEESSTPLT